MHNIVPKSSCNIPEFAVVVAMSRVIGVTRIAKLRSGVALFVDILPNRDGYLWGHPDKNEIIQVIEEYL